MDVGNILAGSHTEQHWRCCRISNPEDLSERKDLNLHAHARGVEHLQINKGFNVSLVCTTPGMATQERGVENSV
jgi:hypothetical protein